jgi:transcriptional regulator with GAF, ATPase, and Fis domain
VKPGEPIDLAALPERLTAGAGAKPRGGAGDLRARVAAVERDLIAAALERNGGVVRRAAADLGMNPVTLGRRVRRLGLVARG